MKDFNQEFKFFTDLINSDSNFSFTRYGDGEVALMKGEQIGIGTQAYHVDGWSSPSTLTKVGRELLDTLTHQEPNFYYGIPADSDFGNDPTAFNFLTSRIANREVITFANLWINANYRKMQEFYQKLTKPVYVICNVKATKANFPFPILEIIPFPDDCISYWENNSEAYLEYLQDQIPNISNQTFLIAAGPVSEILIHNMFNINPNNQYIDVGSSIDEFVHGYKTRPYMESASNYSKQISKFNTK